MKRFLSFVIIFAMIAAIIPTLPVFAWDMPMDMPPEITDPAFQFPAFDNGEVVLDKVTGRLPALGWNSWNAFSSSINETKIKGIADAFISRGLDKAGYEYVVIDDGCYTNSSGRLTNNSAFASGFKSMADYIHGLGLKFGMYNDVGRVTCQALPGLYANEDEDAQAFAEWDIDYIKVDYCGYPWDVGYQSAGAPNQQYVYAPRIRSITISGNGITPITLYAAGDGIPINSPVVSGSGATGYVARIGTDMGKYCNQYAVGASIDAPFYRELGFNIDVPTDGTYDLTVNYSTGNPSNSTAYPEETSQALNSSTNRQGRWLQVAVGSVDNETRFFDGALPITDASGTTFTYMDSPVIKVDLKSGGDNLLRLMNHRRQENALYSYAAFLDGMNKAGIGDKVVLSLCDWGQTRPYIWGYKVGDSWRTSDDITLSQNATGGTASWGSIAATPTAGNTNTIMGQYNKNVILWEYAGLDKGWNDPDMMVIGMGNITATMANSHMALWCMMNSPIMLGFDITDDAKWATNGSVVLNTDYLALNQDPLGLQCRRVYSSSATTDPSKDYIATTSRRDVLAKPLANGDVALTFINCASTASNTAVSVTADTIMNYIGDVMPDGSGATFKNASSYIVKNLETKAVTTNTTGAFSVPSFVAYGSTTIRITPVAKASLSTLIEEAQAALSAKVNGEYPMNPTNADLQTAIIAAQAVESAAAASDQDIQDAILALSDALKVFRDAYDDQNSFMDCIKRAKKVLSDNAQYLDRISVRDAAEVFKDAISAAETSLANPSLDSTAILAADATLTAAIDAFLQSITDSTLTVKPPWYNKYPMLEKVKLNSPTSLTIDTHSGDFYQISTATFENKKMNNMHLIDITAATTDVVTITCEVAITPTANYQSAGILFYLNDYNMCSFMRRFHSTNPPNNAFFTMRNNGNVGAQANTNEIRFATADDVTANPKCLLRLVKNGTTNIQASYSYDNGATWTDLAAVTGNTNLNAATTFSVGLFASNGTVGYTSPSIPATFENFTINGVLQEFADDAIVSVSDLDYETSAGTPITLPQFVTVTWLSGKQEELPVVWETVAPGKYDAAGSFDIAGEVAGANRIIQAHVTVFDSSVAITPLIDKASAEYVLVAKGKNVDYLMIMALYDRRGALASVVQKTGSLLATDLWMTDSLEIEQPRGYTVKAFLWDAVTYAPLSESGAYLEPWEVDKTALLAAITKAEGINTDAYTRLSEDALLQVLEDAQAVFDDADAPRIMVNSTTETLLAAIDNLAIPPMVKLNGVSGSSYFGSPGTYGGGRTYDRMFDGNITTYYDASDATGSTAYGGINLGAGNETYIYEFRVYPRPDQYSTRINGCTLRGDMTGGTGGEVGTVLHSIEGVSDIKWYTFDSGVKDQKFRYVWIQSSPRWYGNIAELEFYGKDVNTADISLLSDRIAFADSLAEIDYTAPSWADLQTALTPAKTLTTASTQAAVDAAASNLKTALAQLELV